MRTGLGKGLAPPNRAACKLEFSSQTDEQLPVRYTIRPVHGWTGIPFMEDDKKFFYSNAVETAVSQFDVTFKFMRQGTAPASREATVKAVGLGGVLPAQQPLTLDEISVAMSPTHAKAMLASLAVLIVDYEKNIGNIALEKVYQDRYDHAMKKLLEPKLVPPK